MRADVWESMSLDFLAEQVASAGELGMAEKLATAAAASSGRKTANGDGDSKGGAADSEAARAISRAARGAAAEVAERRRRLQRARVRVMAGAKVVCATLSGAGSATFRGDGGSAPMASNAAMGAGGGDAGGSLQALGAGVGWFDVLVVDEAAQAVEPSALVPLPLACGVGGGGKLRCVLVGDPQQLPATVVSREAAAAGYGRSLFERLQAAGMEAVLLSTQYRMHPLIREFPSNYFYNGRLTDGFAICKPPKAKTVRVAICEDRSSDDVTPPTPSSAASSSENLDSGPGSSKRQVQNENPSPPAARAEGADGRASRSTGGDSEGPVSERKSTGEGGHPSPNDKMPCAPEGGQAAKQSIETEIHSSEFSAKDSTGARPGSDGADRAAGRIDTRSPPVWHRDVRFGPLVVYDFASEEERCLSSGSLSNPGEARLCARALANLATRMYPAPASGATSAWWANANANLRRRVVVLTPYRKQVKVLRESFTAVSLHGLEVCTVDSFQGREADVVVLSLVRAGRSTAAGGGGVGFLSDVRRMNVALTRARHSLLVVCDVSSLVGSPHWRAFLRHAQARSMCVRIPDRAAAERLFPKCPTDRPEANSTKVVNLADCDTSNDRELHGSIVDWRKWPTGWLVPASGPGAGKAARDSRDSNDLASGGKRAQTADHPSGQRDGHTERQQHRIPKRSDVAEIQDKSTGIGVGEVPNKVDRDGIHKNSKANESGQAERTRSIDSAREDKSD
mmetsp:Transcript_54478/g.143916  ORF Transcript_54478/g.143916 Transcript_54478/m.143916 type:complete len:738 (+) Transcript_54478:342-2555(+)